MKEAALRAASSQHPPPCVDSFMDGCVAVVVAEAEAVAVAVGEAEAVAVAVAVAEAVAVAVNAKFGVCVLEATTP